MKTSVRAMAVAAAVSILFCGGMNGHAADRQNLFRFGAAYVVPTGDFTTDGFFVEDVDPWIVQVGAGYRF
jgi:outer membrane protein W